MFRENATARTPVWIALAALYLDTELTDDDYKHIADVGHQARLSWAEMQRINQEEVAPVLVYNLLSVAGEWGGFDEQWLVQAITARWKPPTLFGSRWLWARFTKWLLAADLERLRRAYAQAS